MASLWKKLSRIPNDRIIYERRVKFNRASLGQKFPPQIFYVDKSHRILNFDRSTIALRNVSSSFFRDPKRIESYFSAIGGQSDDPPPDLTPEQVTSILRTNESLILNRMMAIEQEIFLQNFSDVIQSKNALKNKKFEKFRTKNLTTNDSIDLRNTDSCRSIEHLWISQIESNQLASNHPTEDRIRITSVNLDTKSDDEQIESKNQVLLLGVFDGHGGGFCADIVSRRLYHYIIVALKAMRIRSKSSQDYFEDCETLRKWLFENVKDLEKSPSIFYHAITNLYEEVVVERMREQIEKFEFNFLMEFFKDEIETPIDEESDQTKRIDSLIKRAFLRCDNDLSIEIESNLMSNNSKAWSHYYYSLAVSGCCTALVLVIDDHFYIASAGDCRAVMGLLREKKSSENSEKDIIIAKKQLRMIELSSEHNSDNINELNRIYSQHAPEEKNFIIRENRLLGQLMPLRAFGDFSFKWSIDKMKQLGLTKAFGSHVIPSFYRSPPYLIVEPEIKVIDLKSSNANHRVLDRFIVLGTDGLWEQFESPRKVIKTVNRYRQNWFELIEAYSSAKLLELDQMLSDRLTLDEIMDRLRDRIQSVPIVHFQPITADDDLIEDINCGTFLLRSALADLSHSIPKMTSIESIVERTEDYEILIDEETFSHHIDQYDQQKRRHSKLVSYLTLPQTVARNFRDDISLIIIGLR
ncbi:[Pyruvate dehydrogenase [acetyl-transferring]]-phosphatase 1 [Sarcoptes scabiei]|uniref:[Pyruvate dehydrogenase [acetyl-transferring]]-phosphatase 1, mitochondrial n=1 Tax=Sarcoptes scabiei TaxID=52283 RepID=A0A834VFP0_SARSC|nr:[Pyruvate dehydrogenase [acetyl-transferring]]-phosphatase 1 [Sarcoptes scabiei]